MTLCRQSERPKNSSCGSAKTIKTSAFWVKNRSICACRAGQTGFARHGVRRLPHLRIEMWGTRSFVIDRIWATGRGWVGSIPGLKIETGGTRHLRWGRWRLRAMRFLVSHISETRCGAPAHFVVGRRWPTRQIELLARRSRTLKL